MISEVTGFKRPRDTDLSGLPKAKLARMQDQKIDSHRQRRVWIN